MGKIGLRDFLFQMKVLAAITPLCSCGEEPETVSHLFTRCSLAIEEGSYKELGDPSGFISRLQSGRQAKQLLRWLMARIPIYQLALELGN